MIEGVITKKLKVIADERGRLMEILRLDEQHRVKHIDDETYYGYLSLCEPIARLMHKSKLFTMIVKPFAKGFAYEMASRMDKNIKGSIIGKIILEAGKPLCRTYYRFRSKFASIGITEVK